MQVHPSNSSANVNIVVEPFIHRGQTPTCPVLSQTFLEKLNIFLDLVGPRRYNFLLSSRCEHSVISHSCSWGGQVREGGGHMSLSIWSYWNCLDNICNNFPWLKGFTPSFSRNTLKSVFTVKSVVFVFPLVCGLLHFLFSSSFDRVSDSVCFPLSYFLRHQIQYYDSVCVFTACIWLNTRSYKYWRLD